MDYLRLQNQPTAESAPYGFGCMAPPSPKPQTSQNKMETAEPLIRKQMLVPTVNPFIVYGSLNPQFLESLKKQ